MRRVHLFLVLASAIALAGCAERIAKGDAAPIAPPDGSDRAGSTPRASINGSSWSQQPACTQ